MRRGGVHGRQAGEAFAAQDRDHGRDGQRVVLCDAQVTPPLVPPPHDLSALMAQQPPLLVVRARGPIARRGAILRDAPHPLVDGLPGDADG